MDRDPDGLMQACAEPGDLPLVVKTIVESSPTSNAKDLVGAVMKHYNGKGNPKTVAGEVNRALGRLSPKQRAGHSADCKMDGCQSVPVCNVTTGLREKIDVVISEAIRSKQVVVLLNAIQNIQREWSPGRKVSRCDPYTVATAALKAYDELDKLRRDTDET